MWFDTINTYDTREEAIAARDFAMAQYPQYPQLSVSLTVDREQEMQTFALNLTFARIEDLNYWIDRIRAEITRLGSRGAAAEEAASNGE